jgi:hypothetical protein
MKKIVLSVVIAAMMAACSSKNPPKPSGAAFPLNVQVVKGA